MTVSVGARICLPKQSFYMHAMRVSVRVDACMLLGLALGLDACMHACMHAMRVSVRVDTCMR